MTAEERQELLYAIACREGTEDEIAAWYGRTVTWLRKFVQENREELLETQISIEASEEDIDQDDALVTPLQLDELWISKKNERLTRYQRISDRLFTEAMKNLDAVSLREFRAYQAAVANELGQLLHRGSGDAGTGDVLTVQWEGVDPDESFK